MGRFVVVVETGAVATCGTVVAWSVGVAVSDGAGVTAVGVVAGGVGKTMGRTFFRATDILGLCYMRRVQLTR